MDGSSAVVRCVFTVLTSLYNNYLVAQALTRAVVAMETLRDGVALLFLLATLPFIALSTPADPVYGIRLLLYGQVAASAITWAQGPSKKRETASGTLPMSGSSQISREIWAASRWRRSACSSACRLILISRWKRCATSRR